jgi:hypothetical protein
MDDSSKNSELLHRGPQSKNFLTVRRKRGEMIASIGWTDIHPFFCIVVFSVTVVEATVNKVLYNDDGVRATGVACSLKGVNDKKPLCDEDAALEQQPSAESTPQSSTVYRSPIVVIADGCFSKFRKQFLGKSVSISSHFVG